MLTPRGPLTPSPRRPQQADAAIAKHAGIGSAAEGASLEASAGVLAGDDYRTKASKMARARYDEASADGGGGPGGLHAAESVS